MRDPTIQSGVTIRRLAATDSIPALTERLHRAYAPLAARGLRCLATHQDADWDVTNYRSVILSRPLAPP